MKGKSHHVKAEIRIASVKRHSSASFVHRVCVFAFVVAEQFVEKLHLPFLCVLKQKKLVENMSFALKAGQNDARLTKD